METREISKLKANPQNPRGAVERDAAFWELVASIKTQGVLQSVLITPNDLIVAGHRRVEAAEEVGLKTVPVVVKELSKIQQLQAMLAENLLRADLNVLQEGSAYNVLLEYGLTVSQISKAIGIPSQRVSDCIAVQSLPQDVQRQFACGVIPVSCAGVLSALPTPAEQARWANEAIAHKWSSVALRNAIHKPERSNGQHKSQSTKSPRNLREIIQQLETLDEQLEQYSDMRPVQLLIRQAASQMITKVQGRKEPIRAEKPKPDRSASLASVASFHMRQPPKR